MHSVYTSRHNNLRIAIYTFPFPTAERPIAVGKRRTEQLPRTNQMSQSFCMVDMLTEHVHEQVTGLVGSGEVDGEDELRMVRRLLMY